MLKIGSPFRYTSQKVSAVAGLWPNNQDTKKQFKNKLSLLEDNYCSFVLKINRSFLIICCLFVCFLNMHTYDERGNTLGRRMRQIL